ncbi:MAG: hypothetical protein M1826_001758 [Phylliscum demangeonii]|nr:MAG: hypothetical protein M1826_001758 [Phylliscum demangeonii]
MATKRYKVAAFKPTANPIHLAFFADAHPATLPSIPPREELPAEIVAAATTMVAYPRRVGFASTRQVSRPAREDELQAMYGFAKHAAHCAHCADPFRTHLVGSTLCERGHQHAGRLTRFIIPYRGRPYSFVDADDSQSVQIEIPPRYDVVRGLLKAIESGLRLRRVKPIASPIAPRAPATPAPVLSYESARPAAVIVPRAGQSSAARGWDRHARIEIVEPPRGRKEDSKVIYVYRDGTPYRRSLLDEYEDEQAWDDDGDNAILYAAPRARTPRRRPSHFVDELFYC